MNINLTAPPARAALANFYRDTLLDDVMPFWLRHGLDREHGGMLSSLNRDGSVLDTDKSVWVQGRAAWMFATLYNTIEARPEWLDAARSCMEFLRQYGSAPNGKLYFTLARAGEPLRMRRYVYSESFAAIACAAYAKASGDESAAEDAIRYFETYLRYSFEPDVMAPKCEPTRPMQGIGPHMIAIATAQELRLYLNDPTVSGRSWTQWIDTSIDIIRRDFWKPELKVLMETTGPNGELLDHFDGRTLNPGHAIECAWFILYEGQWRNDAALIALGAEILDAMWARGWDQKYGGIFYFRDVNNLPIAEYWQDMKFWWPHNEAVIATLLAHQLTGDAKYAHWHALVHNWSFRHFADPQHGEWFGYLHRDGTRSSDLKGNLWKGPFHLPRMLWLSARILSDSK